MPLRLLVTQLGMEGVCVAPTHPSCVSQICRGDIYLHIEYCYMHTRAFTDFFNPPRRVESKATAKGEIPEMLSC